MTLKNYTLKYLSVALLLIIGVWATVFYFNMLDEVYDSIDDGLENYKMLIINKAGEDSSILSKTSFAESNYAISPVDEKMALAARDIYKDTTMFMTNEEDFEPVRMLTTVFAQSGRYYELKVISSMVEEDDLIEDLFYAVVWLYVILILSIVLINHLLLKKIWTPFYQLLDRLNHFKLHQQTSIEVPGTRIDEFNKLNSAVLQMTSQAIETYTNQKQFIENASHELQTPLAISLNKLELMIEKEPAQANLEQLSSVIETLERLTRLNKSLLLLSKIENKQFDKTEAVHINMLCKNLLDEFSDFAAFKNIRLELIESETINVYMDKGLASILLSNLVKNAIIHNREGGIVVIEISNKQLSISNTGIEQPLDAAKIFNRFHKDSAEKQSSGLGLAIAKAIAGLYRIDINYRFDGTHHMELKF